MTYLHTRDGFPPLDPESEYGLSVEVLAWVSNGDGGRMPELVYYNPKTERWINRFCRGYHRDTITRYAILEEPGDE